MVVDGVVITAAFYGAYVLRLGSNGTPSQQSFFVATLPVLLFARYLVFIPLGLYRGVWRYVDVRDAIRIFGADRAMFASNFPVDSLVATFDEIYGSFLEITRDMPDDARRKLFHDNAVRIYRL